MKHYVRMTSTVKEVGKKNAVIMGRKTWESIPVKFRLRPGRLNVVISSLSKSSELFSGAIVCGNFEEALQVVNDPTHQIETAWVAGGSAVYKAALECQQFNRLYMTRIMKQFDCDTFFPTFDEKKFIMEMDADVPQGIQDEDGVQWKVEVWQKAKM